jgi:hypothetical protein
VEKSILVAVPMAEADALPYLKQAAEFDTSGGMLTLEEICNGAVMQAVEHDGRRIGAYALQVAQHDNGKVLWVVACAARLPGQDLTPQLLNIIEQQASRTGADQVAITTRRRGLISKLLQHGYEISGVTLRKKI